MKKNSSMRKALALLLSILTAFSVFGIMPASAGLEISTFILTHSGTHTHMYGNWDIVKAATCTNEGLKIRKCIVDGCDAYYERTIAVSKNAHNYETWTTTVEATCSSAGTKVATCTECNKTATQNILKLAHTFDDNKWQITKQPVHEAGKVTQVGYKRNSCEVCGTTVTLTIEPEHVASGVVSVISPSTCRTKGDAMDICSVCGDVISIALEVDENAHVFTSEPMITKPATCHDTGLGTNQCAECGEILDVEVPVDPYAHVDADGNILEWIVRDEPYNHHDGLEGVECHYCGDQTRKIFADHELTDDDYRIYANPTCTKPGIKRAQCDICRITVEKEIPIDENAHDWNEGEVMSVSTCVEAGKTFKRCNRCYGHVMWEIDELLPHAFSQEWRTLIQADCNTVGKEVNTCVECLREVERVVPIIEDAHDYIYAEWIPVQEADCAAGLKGIYKNYCSDCEKEIIKETSKHENSLVEIDRLEPDCFYTGYIVYECTDCSMDFTEVLPVDSTKHRYMADPAVKNPSTCQTQGDGVTVCTDCKQECYVKLDKDPDAHVDKDGNILEWKTVVEPSGCKNGQEMVDCAECGVVYRTIYSRHNISENNYKITKAVSCTTDGEITSTVKCSDCKQYIKIPLEAGCAGTMTKVITPATCTEDGVALYSCSRGNHLYYEVIPAKGHTASDEYTVLLEATCTQEGERQRYCVTCGEAIEPPEKIKNSHLYSTWIVEVEGTCNSTGTRYRVCQNENCNNKERSTYRAAHVPGQWEPDNGYTCASGGTFSRYCNVCNKYLGSKTVAAGTHAEIEKITIAATADRCISYREVCKLCNETISVQNNAHKNIIFKEGYPATCTAPGLSNETICMVCSYQKLQTVIPALGHEIDYDNDGNKICVRCNEYLIGKDEQNNAVTCKHFCHNEGTIAKLLLRIMTFFWKISDLLSGEPKNQYCSCGALHYTTD